jgi:hypothetical protein
MKGLDSYAVAMFDVWYQMLRIVICYTARHVGTLCTPSAVAVVAHLSCLHVLVRVLCRCPGFPQCGWASGHRPGFTARTTLHHVRHAGNQRGTPALLVLCRLP